MQKDSNKYEEHE